MKNKQVGFLIVGIVLVFLFIVFSFNSALESIVNASCTHGDSCPMQTTLKTQKAVSYSLVGLLLLVATFMIFFMKEEKIILHHENNFSEQEKEKALENLDEEEKKIVDALKLKQGSLYQSDLIKETDFSKVKITRLLDRLEGKGLIERKRRGMTNIVILK